MVTTLSETKHCSTSKVSLMNNSGNAVFLCPSCGKHEIVRTAAMRKISAKYTCPACGFEGPN
jgi:predicted RNA-binding Zn-ribbon protein involved in translation (DUF1610 family)